MALPSEKVLKKVERAVFLVGYFKQQNTDM